MTSISNGALSADRLIERVVALLERGQPAAAAAACDAVRLSCPDDAAKQLLVSHALQRLGLFDEMTVAAARAAALLPLDFELQKRLVECHIYGGRIDLARTHLALLEQRFAAQGALLLRVAELHVHSDGHADAFRCCRSAVALLGDDPQALYASAAAALTMGQLDEAQALFTRVIALDPLDGDAYVSRASLRSWRADSHHLDEMQARLQQLPAGHAAEIPLCYALAKELEDLGEFDSSFALLQRGAQRRRAQMNYRVDGDVQAMAGIARAFDAELLARPAAPADDECGLFVLGLPRSGTTLVERILASHSQVGSVGETNTLAFAIMRLAAGGGAKAELIQRSTAIDFGRLGALYRQGIRSYGQPGAKLIDKTPANFLYLGLAHLALPTAPVVHLRRHPLDSCYAMYKTLFRMGYPFSYSLDDLGHYYLAYHRLMTHWRQRLPGRFVDVDYEALVRNPEAGTRALLSACGLAWEPQCLEFHDNAEPTATASAAQVRQPIYQSSVGRWRQYAAQLAPLAAFLTGHGVDCS